MWSELLIGYGLFILEILTILLIIAGIVMMIMTLKERKSHQVGELVITDLSREYENNSKKLRDFYLRTMR